MRALLHAAAVSLLLAFIGSSPVRAQADDELISGFLRAAAARQDVAAMDLLCRIERSGVECGKADPYAEYYRASSELWHRRYEEVFASPKNADALTFSTWHETALWSGFNRDGVLSVGTKIDGVPVVRYAPWDGSSDALRRAGDSPDLPSYILVTRGDVPRTTVDLDLDGRPELVFSGSSPEVREGLEVVCDDAADGRRTQWLIGPAGSNPRDTAWIWIYRDGCIHMIFVDTDGDGRGNCGVWARVRRPE
jgi:hypothetical protein